MRYRTLLFDLDGTLINSLPDLAAAVNATRSELNYEPLTERQVGDCLGDGIVKLVQRTLPEEDAHAIMPTFRKHYDANLRQRTYAYDGVTEVLAELQAMGCPMGVVTNKVEDSAEQVLEHLGILKYFGVVAGGNGVRALKPAAEPFEYALSVLKSTKEEALMVGDGRPDIIGAKNAGIRTCGVLFGIGRTEHLKELKPDHFIESFDELPALVRG